MTGIGLGLGLPFLSGLTTPYDPTQLTSGRIWLDFSDTSTLWTDTGRTTPVASNGDTIAYADNKYGITTYDFSQGTSGSRPPYNTNIINSKAVATFTVDNYLESSNGFTWTNGGFLWVVIRPTTQNTIYQRWMSFRTNTDSDFNTANTVIGIRGPSTQDEYIIQTNLAAANALSFNRGPTANNAVSYIRMNFTGGNASCTFTTLGTFTDTYTNIDPTPTRMTIGAQRESGGVQDFFEGQIGEFGVAIGPQSAGYLAAHDTYIFNKWGTG
jgi:hypothetical protein